MSLGTYTHVLETEFTNEFGDSVVAITCVEHKRTECAKRVGVWVSCPCCGDTLR